MINYFSYTSQGTGFNTGISTGSFTIPGNVSRGIPMNQPMFYRICPKEKGQIIDDTQDFSATVGTEYYKLSTFNSTRASLVEVPIGNRCIMFDVPRTVKFTLTNVVNSPNVTIVVSYIDQFGQIGRRQSGDFDSNISTFPVGVLGITAVEVIKNAGNTATFNIEMDTTNEFELIYNDYGRPAMFMWLGSNDVNANKPVPFYKNLAENTPFLLYANLGTDVNFGYLKALQVSQTLTTGRPRPIIQFEHILQEDSTISVMQNVLGIGMSSVGTNITPEIATITYFQNVIFGAANYTEGFKSWQG